ncbi:hypothetical protein GJ496_001948 [Pomphorhynchus laevis]|nr:hypothetical protein GJ496_001948 [Pomphorhynchus laevis]
MNMHLPFNFLKHLSVFTAATIRIANSNETIEFDIKIIILFNIKISSVNKQFSTIVTEFPKFGLSQINTLLEWQENALVHFNHDLCISHFSRLLYIKRKYLGEIGIGCNICCCEVNTIEVLKIHQNSPKHRKKIEAREYILEMDKMYSRIKESLLICDFNMKLNLKGNTSSKENEFEANNIKTGRYCNVVTTEVDPKALNPLNGKGLSLSRINNKSSQNRTKSRRHYKLTEEERGQQINGKITDSNGGGSNGNTDGLDFSQNIAKYTESGSAIVKVNTTRRAKGSSTRRSTKSRKNKKLDDGKTFENDCNTSRIYSDNRNNIARAIEAN